MKRLTKYAALLSAAVLLTGCANSSGASSKQANNQNTVDKVLQEQAGNTDENADSKDSTSSKKKSTGDKKDSNKKVDIDLTTMSSDMIYATVYQLMVDPDTYVGQTIKLKGNYSSQWYEPTQQFYHYAIIQDATACCAQGLEFVWGDGSHDEDEYPEEATELIVTGTFETYTEEGDSNLYCRLADASMVVNEE